MFYTLIYLKDWLRYMANNNKTSQKLISNLSYVNIQRIHQKDRNN